MDFVQMLANAANNLSAISTQLVLAIAGVGGGSPSLSCICPGRLAGRGGVSRPTLPVPSSPFCCWAVALSASRAS